ncbi:hypothetical protein GCM10010121_052530 [Streptomyces brasiliensis]|uniref:Uncharacterized protein n=1 Tax=Streptomyces brasiliensis TaxID=1954 RepID=A0A917NW21_9ACTN|nr:hypothetical protein GCM10010121_052530 [Streptomyces brasiliensis]
MSHTRSSRTANMLEETAMGEIILVRHGKTGALLLPWSAPWPVHGALLSLPGRRISRWSPT